MNASTGLELKSGVSALVADEHAIPIPVHVSAVLSIPIILNCAELT